MESIDWVYNQSMGRRSQRQERRAQITQAFAKVLADHGYAGATITAVADEADLSPGLLHHHFKNKQEMLDELLTILIATFRQRLVETRTDQTDPLKTYTDAALALDSRSDTVAAKCWVGLFAEALRQPALFLRVKKHLSSEIDALVRDSGGAIDEGEASAILAFVLGSLVFGAFAPRKAAGFAAPSARVLIDALVADN